MRVERREKGEEEKEERKEKKEGGEERGRIRERTMNKRVIIIE